MSPSIVRPALRRLKSRPQLIFGLWFLSLCTALTATLPSGLALAQLLGHRIQAIAIGRGQADYLWGELLSSQTALAPGLLASAALALPLFWLLQTALAGGITAALLRPGHPAAAAPGQLLARAAASAGAMLRLELLGLFALRLPLLILFAIVAFLLGHKQQLGDSTLPLLLLRFAPPAAVTLLLWSMASITLQLARIYRLNQSASQSSARRALRQALAQVSHPQRLLGPTLRLGLISLLGYGLLLAGGRLLAARLDTALLVGTAFAVRQLCGLGRAALALSVIAATTEAWHHQGE